MIEPIKKVERKVKLSHEHQVCLSRLKKHSDFEKFCDIVDVILVSRTYNLLSDNLTRQERNEELDNIAGGYDLWRYIKNLMGKAEKKLNESQKTDEETI